MKHDMEYIRSIWHSVCEDLIDETGFDAYLRGEQSYFDWRYGSGEDLPEDIWAASGATRVVFGTYSEPSVVFKMLQDRNDIDYNASEAFIYQRAIEAGVSEWFAWTEKVETIEVNGVKTYIYAMDFCDVDGDQLENASYDLAVQEYLADEGLTLEEMSDDDRENMYHMIDDSYCGDSEGIQHYMFATYNYEDMCNLFNFLEDNFVNDTHAGNWGYLNNHLVLIDYGGFERNVIQLVEEAAA